MVYNVPNLSLNNFSYISLFLSLHVSFSLRFLQQPFTFFILSSILCKHQTSTTTMGETKDTHIVEIPVDQEHNHHKNVLCSMTSNMIEAIEDHPLTEISESPGHLLLLKLWQREEELFSKRIAHKETRMDTIKAELFQLSSFFFIFHAFFLTLLFTSWAKAQQQAHLSVCHKWWLPSMVSLCTSFVFVVLVQVKFLFLFFYIGNF